MKHEVRMKTKAIALVAAVAAAVALLSVLAGAGASAKQPRASTSTSAVAIGRGSKFHPGVTLSAQAVIRGRRVRRYQWERCDRRGKHCKKIRGATHRRYTLTRRDVGHRLRALLVVGSKTVTSAPTPVIGPPLPVNTVLPQISDPNPQVVNQITQGDVLHGTLGTWTGAVSYKWQWEQCDTSGASCVVVLTGGPVNNVATDVTYTVASTDVGHTLRLTVVAFNTQQ